jgi:uncharacterized membrane protein (UPF0127 family)
MLRAMSPSLLELPPPLAASPLARPEARKWVGRAVWALAALTVAALFAVGGAQPADPYLATSRVAGYDEGTLKVLVPSPGSGMPIGDYCALLASTAAQHARALQNRQDLGGYAARTFRWDEDVDVVFYNRNVPMALTVAWFDRDGRWIGSRDLEPCPDIEGCPTIAAPGDFRYIVEVEKGGLSRLGLGPGSQIAVTNGC